MPAAEMPQWQCHKKVHAAQIVAIDETQHVGDGGLRLTLTGGYTVFADATWAKRHDAKVGGYYVVYEDGYSSYSPRDAFEGGYSLINPVTLKE